MPDDVTSLAVMIRKIESRLATIEEYLGTPHGNAGNLEKRLATLEEKASLNPEA
jgi:hypothetical protein